MSSLKSVIFTIPGVGTVYCLVSTGGLCDRTDELDEEQLEPELDPLLDEADDEEWDASCMGGGIGNMAYIG